MAQKKAQAKKTPAKKQAAKKAPAKKQGAKKKAPAKKQAAKKKAAPKKPEFLDVVTESVSDAQWDAVEQQLNAVADRAQQEIASRKNGVIKRFLSWVRS